MKRGKRKSLSQGRPPTVKKPVASLSARATRNLIRSHHQLHKARARAAAEGDDVLVRQLDEEIAAKGGLKSYQIASKKGQSKERGGDSSHVLLQWLEPLLSQIQADGGSDTSGRRKLRLLEVGALSSRNACSMAKALDVTRIDLHSQEAGILQQDFMERPLPSTEEETFHIVSLSLVLNYVPEPLGRGEMLRRTVQFLTTNIDSTTSAGEFLPALFLVLPAACVLNSRYLTEGRLDDILTSLGYQLLRRKVSSKLIYYLWRYSQPKVRTRGVGYAKEIISPGPGKNNFAVVLKPSG
ncbi:25S rRNA (adenine2142-N1)-methyltransferase [Microsporum canis]|uniref:25S rRNA adenine-N(1) methyltransferase n=1 Tax=Arthroderma otae (strain ATCC MYA-4605 / CBS 113480) TaxID=554155 RepID=C5FIE9_ARTOC|nr:nucleolus protein [Microsporum canis CBS 113480]EEQ29129.1 nucleolus protein [Microsporum canis CBS 113480]